VNLAPWNWAGAVIERVEVKGPAPGGGPEAKRDGGGATDAARARGGVRVGGEPLVVFHFSRFRPVRGGRWWVSGQLEYGVMPRAMRQAIYGPYVRALGAARDELAARRAGFDFPVAGGAVRLGREWWHAWATRAVFGGMWLRVGEGLWNLRGGVGRWSGRVLAWAASRQR